MRRHDIRRAIDVLLALLLFTVPVHAEDEESVANEAPSESAVILPYGEYFAFGPTLGFQSANGVTAHVGAHNGFIVSGGWQLLFASYILDNAPNIELFIAPQFDLDAKLELTKVGSKTLLGARPGYRYNATLGHGIHLGGYAGVALSEDVTLDVGYGLVVFVDAENRLRRHEDIPSEAEFGPLSPHLQGGLSAALLFTP